MSLPGDSFHISPKPSSKKCPDCLRKEMEEFTNKKYCGECGKPYNEYYRPYYAPRYVYCGE